MSIQAARVKSFRKSVVALGKTYQSVAVGHNSRLPIGGD